MTNRPPLLKWPGGKRVLLKHLLPLSPAVYNDYYEPFLGGGALFFSMLPSSSVLSDNNEDLINCYTQVRDQPEAVTERLRALKNTPEEYYRVRQSTPREDIDRAVRFIYLTTLSFNGIHRVNLKGEFNVPYGYKRHLDPCDETRIYAASSAFSRAELRCEDFETALERAGAGDFIYLDPPYTVAHSNNGFVKYNAKIFSWEDQHRLAATATDLSRRGCRVLISNADHPSVKALYSNFDTITVHRSSRISASSGGRRSVPECIFFNGG